MKTRAEILSEACSAGREWAGERTLAEIWRDCPRGDWMIWLLRHSDADVTHAQWVQIAVACAESVANLNSDPRVKEAIDAAKAWLADPSVRNRSAADAAANAAYAARAARAAYAAAYAAADADAADAARAARAARAAERQKQADAIREIVPCPFAD